MSSNRNIVPQENVEVIPSSQMPGFNESIATMNKFVVDLDALMPEARKITEALKKNDLTDRATRIRAGELVNELKRFDKDGEEEMKPHKKVIKSVTDYIQTHVRKVTNRVEEMYKPLTTAMGDWDRAETKAAEAEKERQRLLKQAELDRAAELKRQEDEKAAVELREKRVKEIRADLKAGKIGKREAARLLKEAGAMEESLKAQAAADEDERKRDNKMEAATVDVKPNIPSVAGNVKRINFSAECTDADGFLSEYVRCCVMAPEKAARMRPMIQVSNQALSAEARGKIKTRPEDDNPVHIYTRDQFEKIYPFVTVKEDRSY